MFYMAVSEEYRAIGLLTEAALEGAAELRRIVEDYCMEFCYVSIVDGHDCLVARDLLEMPLPLDVISRSTKKMTK